jgi:antitoxin component YwqK of YwqJK toxin-antitoxin module
MLPFELIIEIAKVILIDIRTRNVNDFIYFIMMCKRLYAEKDNIIGAIPVTYMNYKLNGYTISCPYVGNLRHGRATIISIFSNVVRVADYYLDRRHGLERFQYKGGRIDRTYVNDKLCGAYYLHDEMDNIREHGWYINNKRNGICQTYHDDGTISACFTYLDDRLHGTYEDYIKDIGTSTSRIKSHKNYVKGKLHGTYKEYNYDYGYLYIDATYRNGKLHGSYREYNHDKIIAEATYVDGELHGDYIHFDNYHLIKTKAKYFEGKLNGPYKEYYNMNVYPYESGTYIDNRKHGPYQKYYKNGDIEERGTYVNDKLHGMVFGYYKDGSIKSMIKYVNDTASFAMHEFYKGEAYTSITKKGDEVKYSCDKHNNLKGLCECVDVFDALVKIAPCLRTT